MAACKSLLAMEIPTLQTKSVRVPDPKKCTASAHLCLCTFAVAYMNRDLDMSEVKRFKDGEISVKIAKNVRGNDAFVVQVSSPNPQLFHVCTALGLLAVHWSSGL